MKTQSSSALQFSGYPLRIVEDNVLYFEGKSHLTVVKQNARKIRSEFVTDVKASDPANWDAEWFSNYE